MLAFPQVTVNENFNRADENPINSNWDFYPASTDPMRIVSNQITGSGVTYSKSYWTAATISRPYEFYVTCVSGFTGGGLAEFDFCISGTPGGGDWNAYRIYTNFPGNGQLQLRTIQNGAVVGTNVDINSGQSGVDNGDQIGVRLVPGLISIYFKDSVGSWSFREGINNNLHTTGYPIALGTDSTGNTVYDDLAFGTISGYEMQTIFTRRPGILGGLR